MATVGSRSQDGQLLAYLLLTFTSWWAIEVPLALRTLGALTASPPMGLHYVASFGPLVAAIAVTLASWGLRAGRELVSRVFRWRAPVRYFVVAVVAGRSCSAPSCSAPG